MRLPWTIGRAVAFGIVLGIGWIAWGAAGCYEEPRPTCGFRCGAAGACPPGYACGDEGRCVLDGAPAGTSCAAPTDAGAPADAAIVDAPPAVVAVGCPPAPDAQVGVADGPPRYVPEAVTIPPGGTVRFVMDAAHDVTPATAGELGLQVEAGATTCLLFLRPGVYDFACGPHGHAGQIVVE